MKDKKEIVKKVLAKLALKDNYFPKIDIKDFKDFLKANPPRIKTYISEKYKGTETAYSFVEEFLGYIEDVTSIGAVALNLASILKKIIKEGIYTKSQIENKLPSKKEYLDNQVFGERYQEIQ